MMLIFGMTFLYDFIDDFEVIHCSFALFVDVDGIAEVFVGELLRLDLVEFAQVVDFALKVNIGERIEGFVAVSDWNDGLIQDETEDVGVEATADDDLAVGEIV